MSDVQEPLSICEYANGSWDRQVGCTANAACVKNVDLCVACCPRVHKSDLRRASVVQVGCGLASCVWATQCGIRLTKMRNGHPTSGLAVGSAGNTRHAGGGKPSVRAATKSLPATRPSKTWRFLPRPEVSTCQKISTVPSSACSPPLSRHLLPTRRTSGRHAPHSARKPRAHTYAQIFIYIGGSTSPLHATCQL
jgi:hypothetical protein